jgi:S-adenosylmethionine synthetase
MGRKAEDVGAGDQGIMMGYATSETPSYMPMTHYYASKICEELARKSKDRSISWLRPDGKCQVTFEYKKDGVMLTPKRAHTILVSC